MSEPTGVPTPLEQATAYRNALLLQSDWTQLPDVDLLGPKVADWRKYRKALRDLPKDPAWPNVTFPTPPTD